MSVSLFYSCFCHFDLCLSAKDLLQEMQRQFVWILETVTIIGYYITMARSMQRCKLFVINSGSLL